MGEDMLLFSEFPSRMVTAALRFVAHGGPATVLNYLHFVRSGDGMRIEATDAYRAIRLSTPLADARKDKVDFDLIIDCGEAHISKRYVSASLMGDGRNYRIVTTNPSSGFTKTLYVGMLNDRFADKPGGIFPNLDKIFPAEASAFDGYVGAGFASDSLTDICKAARDIGAPGIVMRGTAHDTKSKSVGAVVFEAEGCGVTMRALLMPQRGGQRRAYVMYGDAS